jgi:hypothetical protein
MANTRRRRIQLNPGDRFNRFTVIDEAEPVILSGKPARQFLCLCDCGRMKTVRIDALRSGRVKSCGCLHDTLPIKHGQGIGGEKTRTYRTWLAMRTRCLNPNSKDYPRYGGRGIRVCKRWDDFTLFLEDMGERPSETHSIDRIDPNDDYTPDNCRWATSKEQGRNRRNNRKLTHSGESLCIAEWAEKTGISLAALKCRLDVCGYTVEEALTLPIGVKRHND